MPEIMKIRRIAARAAALLCAAVMLFLFCVPQNAYASTKHTCKPNDRASLWNGMDRTDTTVYSDKDNGITNLHLTVEKSGYYEEALITFNTVSTENKKYITSGFTLVVEDKYGNMIGKFYDKITTFTPKLHGLRIHFMDCTEGASNAIKLFYNDYVTGGSKYHMYIESITVDSDAAPSGEDWGITRQPTDRTAAPGKKATFSLTTYGSDLSYQWYIDRNDGKGWREINGANGTSHVTTAVTKNCDGFRYYCKVTNAKGGEMASAEAVLHVTPAPPTGDASAPGLWLAALTVSCLAVLMLHRKAKKSDR